MLISKAEFARRRHVSKPRVSQWLRDGKIFGPAIVDGQIDEAVACQQLGETLDPDQRHSGNGLRTNLVVDAPPPAPTTAPIIANTLERQLLEERLEKAKRDNRAAALQETIENGTLCDVAEARRAAAREAAQLIARFEGGLPELATAIAAQFKLPQRDVLHLLRGKWREIRVAASIEARERAEPMPERTGFDLAETP